MKWQNKPGGRPIGLAGATSYVPAAVRISGTGKALSVALTVVDSHLNHRLVSAQVQVRCLATMISSIKITTLAVQSLINSLLHQKKQRHDTTTTTVVF